MPITIDSRPIMTFAEMQPSFDPRHYVLKVTKTDNDACGEVVVEKRSLTTFFEKYFYSGKYTYDLSKIRTALNQVSGQEEVPRPIIERCCRIFNQEVQDHNQSIWTRISNCWTKILGYLPFSIQEIALERFSQVTTPATANQEPITLADIQKAAFIDIGKASVLLEEYQKQKQTPLEEADICQGFDILDDSIGDKWKGICTVEYFNNYILCADDNGDPDTLRIHTHVESLKEFLESYPRGFSFFRKGDHTLHVFKLSDGNEVMHYQKSTNSWEICRDATLQEMLLQPDDLCVSLGAVLPAAEKATTFHSIETPESKRSHEGFFYHEEQSPQSASLCAVHAANHYLGYHAIDISAFFPFARQFVNDRLNLTPEALYLKGTNVADVRQGADPAVLIAFLKHLAETKAIPECYAHLHVAEVKSKKVWNDEIFSNLQAPDRIIIGYGGFHFASLRKDAENQKWYLIDSMHEDSQQVAYNSLKEAVTKSPLAEVQESISLIYSL